MSTLSFSQSTTLSDLQDLVVRITRRRPELAERAMKAALLLASGHVVPLGGDRFRVAGTDTYAVDLLGKTCSCPDFAHGAPAINDAKWCKHLLAALMLTYLGEQSVAREARRHLPPEAARTVRVPLVSRFAV